MRGQEYKARDKIVKKISKEGLTEKNLCSKEVVRVSKREKDIFSLYTQKEEKIEISNHTTENVRNCAGRRKTRQRIQTARGFWNSEKNVTREDNADTCSKEEKKDKQEYERGFSHPLEVERESSSTNQTEIEEGDNVCCNQKEGYEGEKKEVYEQAKSGQKKQDIYRKYRRYKQIIYNEPLVISSAKEDCAISEPHSLPKEEIDSWKNSDDKEKLKNYSADVSEQSIGHPLFLEDIRGNPQWQCNKLYTDGELVSGHARMKKTVQLYDKEAKKEEKGKTGKQNRLKEGQKKKEPRLIFEENENGMVKGTGMGIAKKVIFSSVAAIPSYIHGKIDEDEQNNAAIESIHRTEQLGEDTVWRVLRISRQARLKKKVVDASSRNRLQFGISLETINAEGTKDPKSILRSMQKQRYKKIYQAAKHGTTEIGQVPMVSQTFLKKTKNIVVSTIKKSKGILWVAVVLILLFLSISSGISSCSSLVEGAMPTIVGTTYASEDSDIYAVEEEYSRLEAELNEQVNSMESRHPGYDEYRYQVDEISHNPYHLISYFTTRYGTFTYAQVVGKIEEIFREQYEFSIEESRGEVTETRAVRVGESLGQVVTSGYCSCSICCGVWLGGTTASGVYPMAEHTIAVDARNPFVPMGTKVVMNGVEYVVEDTGNFAQYGVQFDIYYADHEAASVHGHQTWEAYIADSNGSEEVEVTSTRQISRLDITLKNRGLDAVLRRRMSENEEKCYELYNITYGNRNYLFDLDTLPSYGGGNGFGYEIPAEALSDEKFAKMIHEAEKYLGFPYVWGGASPSTSFDCSGFVSWVINNCGNGWNVGRQTAEGLRSCCAYVAPSEAKPGDLIFFQGTYNTLGASHVGIYVGENMMIHCGEPIQYANISTQYWRGHFMAFGRIQ